MRVGLVSLLLWGCDEDAPAPAPEPPCTPVGDPGASPLILELLESDEMGGTRRLTEGGLIHLERPVQGGHVVYVTARVTGLCTESVLLTGRIRSIEDDSVLNKDIRRGFGLKELGDGTATSDPVDLSTFSNIALCPEVRDRYDVEGTQYILEIEVEDIDARVAKLAIRVTPTCGQSDEAERSTCSCECNLGGVSSGCG